MSNKKYDFVLFGASGYAGEYCMEEISRLEKMGKKLNWAAAGRNTTKLKDTLKSAYAEHGVDSNHVDLLRASLEDEASLKEMCQQAKLLVNCVGPFDEKSFKVIEACLDSDCHYIDVSVESEFQETVAIRYNAIAKEKGLYIILSCAVFSLLSDISILHLKKNFEGDVNSVETYFETGPEGDGPPALMTVSTWISLILDHGGSTKLRHLQEATKSTEIPRCRYPLEKRFPIHYSEVTKRWCLHEYPCNIDMAKKTQSHLYKHNNERPSQLMGYVCLSLHVMAVIVWMFMKFIDLISSLPYGKCILSKYYKWLSLGTVEDGKPLRSGFTTVTCRASGWKTKLTDPNMQHNEPPNKFKTLITTCKGSSHFFSGSLVATAIHLFWSQHDKLPQRSGVFSPGAAYKDTDFVPFLETLGVSFQLQGQ